MSKKLLAAIFLSLLIHIPLLLTTSKPVNSSKNLLRSKFNIDLIKVTSKETIKDNSGNKSNSSKSNALQDALKGKDMADNDKYLAYVRQAIVERKRFPYAAKRMGLSSKYSIKLEIKADGSFEYTYSSKRAHALFDEAVDNVFLGIQKFKAPPKKAGPLVIVFDLEFEN